MVGKTYMIMFAIMILLNLGAKSEGCSAPEFYAEDESSCDIYHTSDECLEADCGWEACPPNALCDADGWCTEIELLVQQEHVPGFPLLPSAEVHIQTQNSVKSAAKWTLSV